MMRPRFIPATVSIAPNLRPNAWDMAALPLVLIILVLLAYGGAGMDVPYNIGDALPISLDPSNLPYYLLRTTLRMAAGLVLSLIFAFLYATLAAKSRQAEKILIPVLDILQSIPILGFLSITITGFIAIFPGSLLGVECAAIFAIFTSQAWNMTFSVYQSMRGLPSDLSDAASSLRMSFWQRFWRLEIPFAMPGLVWNMIVSVSGGWFFVVASEAISVSGQNILLPGVGSYISVAIAARDHMAIIWAITTMMLAVMLYDQLLFRPLLAWAEKFKSESIQGEQAYESWLFTLMQRAKLVHRLADILAFFWDLSFRFFRVRKDGVSGNRFYFKPPPWFDTAWNVSLALLGALALLKMGEFVNGEVGWDEVGQVFVLGLITCLRVVVLISLASLVWVPLGVWIGLRPKAAQWLQWLAQMLAAFPANLTFPIAVALILHFNLNVDIWTSPLMILGTQWYILFNVIAGASALPSDLKNAADNLGLTGWLKWKRFILPGIFPYYLTGAITASGGSWNASIVSEMVSWGDTTLVATGLGSYIAIATKNGDFPRIALGIGIMCIFVMGFNRFVWRALQVIAEERLRM